MSSICNTTEAAPSLLQGNDKYLSAAYWDSRFQQETSYEWLQSYEALRPLLAKHLKSSDRILIVGNGTSALPLDLAADGFCHITATDLSPAAVKTLQLRLQQHESQLPGLIQVGL